MSWTKQQENAINARNASIIVSAAAGSGKTAVLTERLAQIIADQNSNIRADRIIVVTFTNDAASELRKRLDSKIRSMIMENPENSYLLKQQTLLQNAKISTINSFCFDLLRDNITDQGITSSFTILDDSENDLIKAQAMDQLINYYSSEEYEKISFMYDNFCIKSDEKLSEILNTVDKYLTSVAMRDKWLDDAVSEFDKNPYESLYFKKILESAVINLKSAVSLAYECCEMLDDIFGNSSEVPSAVKSYAQADDDKNRIEITLNILESGRMPSKDEISFCASFGRLVTVKKNEDIDIAKREYYKIKRKAMINLTKETIHLFDNFERDLSECRDVTIILSQMLRKYQEIIWQRKCEKNALSFDDGERLVLEILADTDENGNIVQSETAAKISEFYDIIMVDEYQDSNNKQDMIFKLISKNYCNNKNGIPIYGSNVFLVGDVKQSIYKFRLANPKNFINTINESVPYDKNTYSANFSITLNKNFRSSEGVVQFINFIFTQLMSEKCGDVNYNDDEKLYFGACEYQNVSNLDFLTNISLINTEIEDIDSNKKTDILFSLEAEYTANKIYSMIKNKNAVITKNGKMRSCEPADFCILIRKNKYAKEYINALNKRGIEARGEEEVGYLNSREIAILLDLLRIIDNPLLDVPFAAVMMSSMYMFEFEEIAYLKTLNKTNSLFTILNDLVNNKYGECSDIFFIERCNNFLYTLNNFRLCSITMTVGELIGKIYDTTDFIAVMQLSTDGDKKRANLRALIQHAKNYESASSFEGSGGLSGFIRYIDKIIQNGKDFTQGKISSSTGNYVSIKTIHKSKGLEYPFVFLAETSSNIKFDSPSVICTDDKRIGYILNDPKLLRRYKTNAYKQIIKENNKDIISEEIRLLYVALTRAKQKLFINLTYNEKRIKRIKNLISDYHIYNQNISELAQNAKCHADWIWISMFKHFKFREAATKIGLSFDEISLPETEFKEDLFKIESAVIESDYSNASTIAITEEVAPDMNVYNNMKKIIDYKYDTFLSKTPAKLSVTQISKKFNGDIEEINFKLKRPRFTEESSEMTGAEKGTAIHTFFQYCNFENTKLDPETELKRMTDIGYLSYSQAKSINLKKIKAFFNSDLYRRITNADEIWREKKFMVSISELNINNEYIEAFRRTDGMIKGIVDLIFEESGNLILVDYKSDIVVSVDLLKKRYKMQLNLYKSAMELTIGKKVTETYLYSIELQKEIKIEL